MVVLCQRTNITLSSKKIKASDKRIYGFSSRQGITLSGKKSSLQRTTKQLRNP